MGILNGKVGFRRLNIGFIAVITITVVNLIFNFYTALSNKSKLDSMNNDISPYINSLDDFDLMVTNSKLWATSWVYLPNNTSDRDALKQLHESGYPEMKERLTKNLDFLGDSPEKDTVLMLMGQFEELLMVEKDLMNILPDFAAYEDAMMLLPAQDMLDSEVLPRSEELLGNLEQLVRVNKQKGEELGKRMTGALDVMLLVVPIFSLVIFFIIVLAFFYIQQTITSPVVKVKDNLNELSKGRIPKTQMDQSGDDVIGQMVHALNELNDSFTKTAVFATEIGKGNLSTEFSPLSKEDRLGNALLGMRSSLQEYSEEMELKVTERTRALSEKEQALQKAYNELQVSEEEAKQSAEELLTTNEQLESTLTNLKETQSQLVQSEKMASLGQLIAGVAHEVNTPLGAIKASIGAVQDSMEHSLEMLPKLPEIISDKEEEELFQKMINQALNANRSLTSREERQFRRVMRKELEEQEVEDASDVASMLVDAGVYEGINEFLPLIRHENKEYILKMVYYLAMQKKNSENIELAVQKASKVVFALKNYSRQDHTGQMQKTSIADSIETVLTLYHNQLKLGIEVNKNFEEVPEIFCYPDELSQVWTNIITNGVQAMNNKGVLDISMTRESDVIEVNITDHGPGIPEKIKNRIFDPFFTTKKAGEGSGLGLDIVKKIVEKHKGEITFETEKDKGTTFKIVLPIITELPKPEAEATTEEA